MAIKVNARKDSWWWKWFHTCEFEFVEEVHYWIRQVYLNNNYADWYEHSNRVERCKHCGKVVKTKHRDIVLPVGGRNVVIKTYL